MYQSLVIPNEVRNLDVAANCRSLTSFGMTIHKKYYEPAVSQ
jgi:hypothetical protein